MEGSVHPSFQTFIKGIISPYDPPLIPNRLTISQIRSPIIFSVHAISTPNKSKEFALAALRLNRIFESEEKFSLGVANFLKKLIKNQFKASTELTKYKFLANLWLEGLIDDEFVLKCDEKIRNLVKREKSDLNLLLYANFCVFLREEIKNSERKLNLPQLDENIERNSLKDLVEKYQTLEDYEKLDEIEIFDADAFKLFMIEWKFCNQNQLKSKIKNFRVSGPKSLKEMAKIFLDEISEDDDENFGNLAKFISQNVENFKNVLAEETVNNLREKFESKSSENYINLLSFAIGLFNYGWIKIEYIKELLEILKTQKKFEIISEIIKKSSLKLSQHSGELEVFFESKIEEIFTSIYRNHAYDQFDEIKKAKKKT